VLTADESEQLASLLGKVEWPVPPNVFHALMKATVSVPIELGVFDSDGRVLLIYRDDFEFKGWHMPGTVLRENEDIPTAIKRLGQGEVKTPTSPPISLGWAEIKGVRHEVSLLHVCRLEGAYSGEGQLFDPRQLPPDTLDHHQYLIGEMLSRAAVAGVSL
jgi:hypothetical protein